MTLHTDLGDIKVELYCEKVPKACEVAAREWVGLPQGMGGVPRKVGY